MLLAIINPPAVTTQQDTPFSAPTSVEGKYMRVVAEKYELKPEKVRFNVWFGYLIPNGIDRFEFRAIHRDSVTLTSEELVGWGEDDSVIFDKIAPKFNVSIVEVQDLNIKDDF